MHRLLQSIKHAPAPVFLLLIVLPITLYFNYNEYMVKRPQSIHAWRQADCASIALNYFQNGMNFFKPEVHNQTSDGGTSGYCATSEAPIMYYFVASLYKVFGYHEIILRMCNSVFFFLGLFYLFKIIYDIGKNVFWSVSISLIYLCSPVLVYYGNGFLSNTSALSVVIVAWYYFFKFLSQNFKKHLIKALLLFLFAGLLKVTALMSLFAVVGYLIAEILFISPKKRLIKKNKGLLLGGVFFALIINVSWLLYADYYNRCHDCTYFSTNIFPIWSMTLGSIVETLKHIKSYWLVDYYHPILFAFFFLLVALLIVKFKFVRRHNLIILGMLLLQSAFFVILQFWTFHDHDYYLINQFIIPIFLLVTVYEMLQRNNSKLLNSIFVKVLFVVLIMFNLVHTNQRVVERYTSSKNLYYQKNKPIYTITPFLRELGIERTDKIIYIPDYSNVSLYLMNQPGWTQYTDARFNTEEPIRYNVDSVGIRKSIERGAKFMVVNNIADVILRPYLDSYTKSLIGEYQGVLIFDLLDTVPNIVIGERNLLEYIVCDAETINGAKFSTSIADIELSNTETRTEQNAFEGNYSVVLDANNPYSMTFITTSTRFGQSFRVSVYRNGSDRAGIIASGSPETKFYHNTWEVVETKNARGWEKIETEFFIPESVEGNEFKIFLYNPFKDSTYFDKLTIEWYDVPSITHQ